MKKKVKAVKAITMKVTMGMCPHCGDILISLYRHDFSLCRCKKSYIDGGLDYIRATTDLKIFVVRVSLNDYRELIGLRQ